MAPASKEGVTVADKEYLLGNKARELLKYTNQATKNGGRGYFTQRRSADFPEDSRA